MADLMTPAESGAKTPIFEHEFDITLLINGVKGLAELALCGVAPAIANAVYHATGIRVRSLPITPEKLISKNISPN